MRLERGDIQGVLGANGSGKSTLIRLVSGLLTLDTGRVTVFGHDLERDEMAVKRLINRVSVDAAFFKKLSPMENLLFAARLYGLDGRQGEAGSGGGPGPARHRAETARLPCRADEPRDAAEGRDRASAADEPDACFCWTNRRPAWTRARSSTSSPSSRSSTRHTTQRSS